MTLITSIRTKNGILLSADSKELTSGGNLLWADFDDILKLKNEDENSENQCISPKEITDKFKANSQINRGRIKSKNGARKIFKLNDFSALLIAGLANPNNIEFPEIIREINQIQIDNSDYSLDFVIETSFNKLKEYLDLDSRDGKFESEYFLCGFDNVTCEFKIYRFWFNDKYIMENGKPKLDEKNVPLREKYFAKRESNEMLNISGWTNYLRDLTTLNQLGLEISFEKAYSLNSAIMNLAIQMENTSQDVTGIGGKIYKAIIDKNGFKWINDERDIYDLE